MKKRNQKIKSLKLNRQQVSNLNTISGGVGTGTTAQSGATASKTSARDPKKTIAYGSCNLICTMTSLISSC